MSKALVVVDVQRDFCEGGSLAVNGGLEVANDIFELIMDDGWIDRVVATMDWHNPEGTNGDHFSDEPDYVSTWPAHCVAGTYGADLASPLSRALFDDVFAKGQDVPAYSGFQGFSVNREYLEPWLHARDIDDLWVCGVATDYCVKATVFDALDKGFKVSVLSDLTVAVGDKQAALDEMEAKGAVIL